MFLYDLASSQCCLCSQETVFTAAPKITDSRSCKTPSPGSSGELCRADDPTWEARCTVAAMASASAELSLSGSKAPMWKPVVPSLTVSTRPPVEDTTGTVPYCMACSWIRPQGSNLQEHSGSCGKERETTAHAMRWLYRVEEALVVRVRLPAHL